VALQRVLEEEVMDSKQEASDYDSMDHSAVNEMFVADLYEACEVGEDILDLGTGTAQIPLLLVEKDEDCRVMAADMAVSMLDLALYNVEVAGMRDRVQLQQMDAKDLPCEDEMFTNVISNSIIHHIPEPMTCLQEAVRVTAPRGSLFFRDLLRPDDDAILEQLVETYTGEENERQQKMFADSLRAALSLAEMRDFVSQLGFPAESVQQTSDRHWTWVGVKEGERDDR